MSRRIRSIKPEILDDAVTAGLSDMAFRMLVSVILISDDYGKLRAEPEWLASQVYWKNRVDTARFAEALKELSDAGLVTFYEVAGQRYAMIRNWARHQKISHKGADKIPNPPCGMNSGSPPEGLRELPEVTSDAHHARKESPEGVSDMRNTPNPTPEDLRTDLGSGIMDHGSRTIGAQVDRLFTKGPTAVRASEVFTDAVSYALGSTFSRPWTATDYDALCLALNDLSRATSCPQALAWLRSEVLAWVRAIPESERRFTGGWRPSRFVDWINNCRPSGPAKSGAAQAKSEPEPPYYRELDPDVIAPLGGVPGTKRKTGAAQ